MQTFYCYACQRNMFGDSLKHYSEWHGQPSGISSTPTYTVTNNSLELEVLQKIAATLDCIEELLEEIIY